MRALKEINIIKFNVPLGNIPNHCYRSIENNNYKLGDIVENIWLLIEVGRKYARAVNLLYTDIVSSPVKLEHPAFIFSHQDDDSYHRYHIDHYKLDRFDNEGFQDLIDKVQASTKTGVQLTQFVEDGGYEVVNFKGCKMIKIPIKDIDREFKFDPDVVYILPSKQILRFIKTQPNKQREV